MGLAATTVKRLLLLLNSVFSVLGLALIAFGIFVLISASIDKNAAGGFSIGLGVAILIIEVFGCLAAIHEAPVRLRIYIGAVVLLILPQLLFLIASYVTKDVILGRSNDRLERLWRNERGALAYYENWLHCCGVISSHDYWLTLHAIPPSCCLDNKCVDQSSVYKVGCKAEFTKHHENVFLVIQVVWFLLIIGESVEVVLAWLLYRNIKRAQHTENATSNSEPNNIALTTCEAVNS